MRLPKDLVNKNIYTKPDIFLCGPDKTIICKLEISHPNGLFKFNTFSEFNFEVYRFYNDDTLGDTKFNPYYDQVEAFKYIYLKGFGYFELQAPVIVGDGITEKKECTAYSSEYSLSSKYLDKFFINTGEVDSVEVIEAAGGNIIPVTLYNRSNPKLSLLNLVLEKIHGWNIGHVDASLEKKGRTFKIDHRSIYDFLVSDICEKFNCYIIFDTVNNTINIYEQQKTVKFFGDNKTMVFTITPPFNQIHTVSIDGYKTTQWEYNSSTGALTFVSPPKAGSIIEVVDDSTDEWDSDIYISYENLAHEVNISYDADSIKTVLNVKYGEDHNIREINLGVPYLTDISYYYNKESMGEDLFEVYGAYMSQCNEYNLTYSKNSQDILVLYDKIDYEENRLSLKYSIANSVNEKTVGTYYVRGGVEPNFYYTEVTLPQDYKTDVQYYSLDTTNLNEDKVGKLYSALKTYYIERFKEDDINAEETWEKELKALEKEFAFMDPSGEVTAIQTLIDSLRLSYVLDQSDEQVEKFLNKMWEQLGRTPLKLYLDIYKKIQMTNIEMGWSEPNNDNYYNYYPNTIFMKTIEKAIELRDIDIDSYTKSYQRLAKQNQDIANELDLDSYFLTYFTNKFPDNPEEARKKSKQCLIVLDSFLREDEVSFPDIVETEQDSLSDSFKLKQDAMESGRIELEKLSQPKLSFNMTMGNIYALKEFEPLIDQFQLGNVIKVGIRENYIKKARLLSVNIDFDNFSNFSCEFGELLNTKSQADIQADLLSQAIQAGHSVATHSDYWTKGSDEASFLGMKIQQGLLDAATQIKSVDGTQNVVIDKYGIKLSKKNEDGSLDPKQVWMVNNQLVFTDDSFKTSRAALGNFTFYNPITKRMEESYGVIANTLIGSLVLSEQVGVYSKDNSILLGDNGLTITTQKKLNSSKYKELFTIQKSSIDKDGNEKIEKMLYVDDDGNLVMNGSVNINTGGVKLPIESFGDYKQFLVFNPDIGLIVGEKDSEFKTIINNDGIFFTEDQNKAGQPLKWDDFNKLSWIDHKKLYITDAQITSTLYVGNFYFQPRPDNSAEIKWTEDINLEKEI